MPWLPKNLFPSDLSILLWPEKKTHQWDFGEDSLLGSFHEICGKASQCTSHYGCKKRFLAAQARLSHAAFLLKLKNEASIHEIQFDEMETMEHTKLKPLSIPLVVVTKKRKILAFDVASMPAKGLLAKKSVEKYGVRSDERRTVIRSVLKSIKDVVGPALLIETDENPHYPDLLKEQFPLATHRTTKGRRGCITGQGELKKTPWDPLFSLNHTAAMFRYRINRLVRRTWCTTKKPQCLRDHIAIYINYHNNFLTQA